jgi:hypothetical protein
MITNRYGVTPGDIYSTSWGYDETHVNFYQVVRVTAAKAEVLPIGATHVKGGVVPNPDAARAWDVLIGVTRESPDQTKLCSVRLGYQGKPSIVLRGGQHWAYQWDGKPEYQSDPWNGR